MCQLPANTKILNAARKCKNLDSSLSNGVKTTVKNIGIELNFF